MEFQIIPIISNSIIPIILEFNWRLRSKYINWQSYFPIWISIHLILQQSRITFSHPIRPYPYLLTRSEQRAVHKQVMQKRTEFLRSKQLVKAFSTNVSTATGVNEHFWMPFSNNRYKEYFNHSIISLKKKQLVLYIFLFYLMLFLSWNS